MISDKELEMLWKEAMDQKPSTNARKIMMLISTIREQREWLTKKDITLELAKTYIEGPGIKQIIEDAQALGSEQTSKVGE